MNVFYTDHCGLYTLYSSLHALYTECVRLEQHTGLQGYTATIHKTRQFIFRVPVLHAVQKFKATSIYMSTITIINERSQDQLKKLTKDQLIQWKP